MTKSPKMEQKDPRVICLVTYHMQEILSIDLAGGDQISVIPKNEFGASRDRYLWVDKTRKLT